MNTCFHSENYLAMKQFGFRIYTVIRSEYNMWDQTSVTDGCEVRALTQKDVEQLEGEKWRKIIVKLEGVMMITQWRQNRKNMWLRCMSQK